MCGVGMLSVIAECRGNRLYSGMAMVMMLVGVNYHLYLTRVNLMLDVLCGIVFLMGRNSWSVYMAKVVLFMYAIGHYLRTYDMAGVSSVTGLFGDISVDDGDLAI